MGTRALRALRAHDPTRRRALMTGAVWLSRAPLELPRDRPRPRAAVARRRWRAAGGACCRFMRTRFGFRARGRQTASRPRPGRRRAATGGPACKRWPPLAAAAAGRPAKGSRLRVISHGTGAKSSPGTGHPLGPAPPRARGTAPLLLRAAHRRRAPPLSAAPLPCSLRRRSRAREEGLPRALHRCRRAPALCAAHGGARRHPCLPQGAARPAGARFRIAGRKTGFRPTVIGCIGLVGACMAHYQRPEIQHWPLHTGHTAQFYANNARAGSGGGAGLQAAKRAWWLPINRGPGFTPGSVQPGGSARGLPRRRPQLDRKRRRCNILTQTPQLGPWPTRSAAPSKGADGGVGAEAFLQQSPSRAARRLPAVRGAASGPSGDSTTCYKEGT